MGYGDSHPNETQLHLRASATGCGFIIRLLRSDAMRESVIYQDIQQEKALSIVMRLLRPKVGTVPPTQLLKIEALDSTQLDDLAEALLDFKSLADLEAWLAQN
jgi:predicted signal transduction protein with EAL and GGDEF domain